MTTKVLYIYLSLEYDRVIPTVEPHKNPNLYSFVAGFGQKGGCCLCIFESECACHSLTFICAHSASARVLLYIPCRDMLLGNHRSVLEGHSLSACHCATTQIDLFVESSVLEQEYLLHHRHSTVL